MFSRIEARNFRSLRYITQDMGPFQALVGPNASGKTTYFDVINFLHDVVTNDVSYALKIRDIVTIHDMFWNGEGEEFELAVECLVPEAVANPQYPVLRYEMSIGIINEEPGILNERLLIKKLKKTAKEKQLELFPRKKQPPDTILSPKSQSAKTALSQLRGRVNYHSEKGREKGEGGFFPSMQFDPKRSALGSLFEDTTKFPASLWFKQLLMEGVQPFVLNSLALRKPSPPSLRKGFRPDGSNLPWIIAELSKKAPESFQRWLEHVRTALPDIETIVTVEREEDKHCYLKIQYHNGCLIPSWLVSDGTLRLLALTIPAYLTDIEGVYLIEEPENGVHPAAVKTITDSLQSVYGAQVLLATHSPIVLGELSPSNILCFAKTEEGATDIVRGDEHPKLREWRGTPGLETLFASGVLG